MSGPSVALSEVIAEARPGFASGSDLTDGVAQLRMNNLTREGKLDWSKIRRVEPPKKVEHLLLEPGDVLFNATNSPELVGKTAFFDGFEEPITFSNHFLRLRPKKEQLDGRYLAHWMQKQFASGRFARMCKQWVNQATVSKDLLLSLAIPLPRLDEQRRIAAVLDQAKELRAKRRAAIALLDQLPQAIFLEMFGDPATNPKAWPVRPLSAAVDGKYGIKAGPFGSAIKKEDYVPHGYRVYGQEQVIGGSFEIGNYYIDERKFRKLESCAVRAGDLLMSLVGSFGKVLVVPEGVAPGIINPRLLKITPNSSLLISTFLAHQIQFPSTQSRLSSVAHGGTMGVLNAGILKGLMTILPPIELQHRFAARVEAIHRAKAAHQSSLTELDALFASLQGRAFEPSPVVAQVASSR